ncbi:GDSL/SGNH-like acyl-esterase family found in Pmr5 and Cas1p-domain-containing protein [Dichotomocladium elegans]|nr:GDSL/SGNH-like acyl-esterase family found in Pmr5 and Cas1p-domain-containing protein [Dichotomocladium elegans]
MPTPETSIPQSTKTRLVCVMAATAFTLLWVFTWSGKEDVIKPAHDRGLEWPSSYTASLEPMGVELPEDIETLCTSETYNQGEWIREPIKAETTSDIETVAGYHCPSNFPHKCYRRGDERPSEFNRSVHILDYTWAPSTCDVLPFDADRYATYLSDHPLMFVGDSINQLEFESMACLLGQHLQNTPWDTNITGGDNQMWASTLVHRNKLQVEGAVTLAYLRTDYLVRLDDFKLMQPNDPEGYLIGKGNNFPWVHALDRFDHIVINTAAHWHTDEHWGEHLTNEELMEAYRKAMRVTFDYLVAHLKPIQRVWVRSSPYGHAKCSKYTAPSKTPVVPTRKEGEYEWDMFDEFDQVWKDMIEESGDKRIKFFDVSNMSNLRGPVDDWNKLLFHEMAREAAVSGSA